MVLILPLFVLVAYALSNGGLGSLPALDLILPAIILSLQTSFMSILVIVLIGTPLAYVLARWQIPAKRFINIWVELPIVLPPAVAGLALLLTFGRRGFLGDVLDELGITVVFTSTAVVIAQIFVSAPFYIRAAQIGFNRIPDELEDAARVDGASEWQVFWQITLPLAFRALSAGMVLAWARALGEFGATILFAGSLSGRTQTMPLLVYAIFERDIHSAVWVGLLLVLMALIALAFSQLITPKSD